MSARMKGPAAVRRRGTVIIMVLVLLAIGALVVAGLLNRASVRMEQSRARLDQMQARALAQSGLEGVLVEVAAQREKLLAGGEPELTAEWTTPVAGAGGALVGRVRLVALAQTSDGRDVLALSQGACADVMALPRESMVALLGEEAGSAMVAARGSNRVTSVLGAMNAAGIAWDAQVAWDMDAEGEEGAQGPGGVDVADDGARGGRAGFQARMEREGRIDRSGSDASAGSGGGNGGGEGGALLVRDTISVGAFDPIGLMTGEGLARVDVSGAVDASEVEEVAKQIEDAFAGLGAAEVGAGGADADARGEAGEGDADESVFERRAREDEARSKAAAARVSELMAKVFDSDSPPRNTGELLRAMRRAGAAPSAWRLAWGVRFGDELYSRGRVDVNRAPREVLAAVPGIDAMAAEKIVARREGLSAEALEDPTWPAREGILTPEELEVAANWITTRSLQWRVRIEAAVVRAGDMGGGEGSGLMDEEGAAPRPISVVTLEVVVDAAGDRARVAYLRDVSLEEALTQVERSQRAAEAESQEESGLLDASAGAGDEVGGGGGEDAGLESGSGGGDALADLRSRATASTRRERLAERERDAERDRAAEGGRVRRGEASARRAAGETGGRGRGEADGEAGSEAGLDSGEKPKRPPRRELEARDNRTGRWRP